jgi:hypothetical protein
MKFYHLVCGAFISLILMTGNMSARAENLFNGQNLSGWTFGESPWVVENGILKNTGAGNDGDLLHYSTQLPVEPFVFEIHMRMVSCTSQWPRLRIYFNGSDFFFGNEGSARQYEIYGNSMTNVVQTVVDDTYSLGVWYTLRLEVNSQNKVSFFRDGILTHTGVLTQRSPSDIVIKAGDNWSGGKIEISSITYNKGHTIALTLDGRSEINFFNDVLNVKELTWGKPTNLIVDGVPQSMVWENNLTTPVSFPLSGEYWIKKVSGRDGGYAVQTAQGFYLGIIDNPNGAATYNFEMRRTPEEISSDWMRVNADGGLPFGKFDLTGKTGFANNIPMGTEITFSGNIDGTNEFIFRNGKLVIRNLSWGPSISNFMINGQTVSLIWTNGLTQEIPLTLPEKFQFSQTTGRCTMYPVETADGFVLSLADEPVGGDNYAWKIVATDPIVCSNFLYTATDDFIVNVYHNGNLVPLQQRILLNEICGATGEKINLETREDDWIVFNVANNILRWNGSCYFAVAGMLNNDTMIFYSNLSNGKWSYCDDPGLANEFIADRAFMTNSRVKTVLTPWSDGDALIKSYVPSWSEPNQSPIWGDYNSRNLWIKVVLSDSYVNQVEKVADPVISSNNTVIPSGGTSVAISCGTSGATIRYTSDGSNPSSTYGTSYRSPIYITNKTTIKAIAYKSGMENSQIVSATYQKENLSAAIKANFLYTVSDDFIVNVYHNGIPVPLQKRTLLSEIFGATGEKVNLQIREGDWVVFNVANNIKRWNGSYYFAVSGITGTDTLAFTTKFPANQWSYCDDPNLAKEFIQNKNFMLTNIVQRVQYPWNDGNSLMQSYVHGWNGDPIWGDFDKRNMWIKFNASSLISGDANFDGMVDVGDLGILAANYGKEFNANWAMGDFNGDEDVDVGDLGILAANYGYGTTNSSNYIVDEEAMGLTVEKNNEESALTGSTCPATGLVLLAGILMMCLSLMCGSRLIEEV